MNSSAFENISLEKLQAVIERGKEELIDPELAQYLSYLEVARCLFSKFKTKEFIINTLTSIPYQLSKYQAKKVLDDSINFFNLNNTVKREAWFTVYADRIDNLALLAIAADDYDVALKCWNDAVKLRLQAIHQESLLDKLKDKKRILYSVDPKIFGLKDVNRNNLAKLIDSLPDISEDDRTRLHRDAMTGRNNMFDAVEEVTEFTDEEQ